MEVILAESIEANKFALTQSVVSLNARFSYAPQSSQVREKIASFSFSGTCSSRAPNFFKSFLDIGRILFKVVCISGVEKINYRLRVTSV